MTTIRNTDELTRVESPIPTAEPPAQPVRTIIDVHIYDAHPEPEAEETHQIEGSLQELPETEQQFEQEAQAELPQTQRRKTSLLLFVCIPLFLLILIAGSFAYLCFFQTATITIIPDTRQITTSGTITIVTETVDATKNQIPGRVLPTLTMSQAETVATTGLTNQEARPGRGSITFYNAALYPQTIPANTILTGADGMQVVTDYSVTVPSEVLPALGSVSVPAHATQTGTQGNIPASAIYGPCCLPNIQALNSAFTGGQDAASYNSVAQADIDRASKNLKTALIQSVTTALQAQVQSNETLVNPLSCQPGVTSDHQSGEKAIQVQVTLTEACTAVTYNTAALHDLIRNLQTHAAGPLMAEHYHLVDDIHTTIQTATTGPQHGTATLTVQSTGTWVYAFSQSQQNHVAVTIAGKTTTQATQILLHVPGIRQASLSTLWIVPNNPQNIHMLFVIQQRELS